MLKYKYAGFHLKQVGKQLGSQENAIDNLF